MLGKATHLSSRLCSCINRSVPRKHPAAHGVHSSQRITACSSENALTISKPDDWHLHVRDGQGMESAVPHSAKHFSRAIIMPNLVPPVATTQQCVAYRGRILSAVPEECDFDPLMTLYLTDNTPEEEVWKAREQGIVAFKLYPAGATTNSDSGVTDIEKVMPVLRAMAKAGLLLLVHGEVTDPAVDIFDREKEFIQRILGRVLDGVPELKVVMEHITTKDAVEFVKGGPPNLAATITPQHMIMNRNQLLSGGLRPHHYCLPILKREEHRAAIAEAATSGSSKFFLGTDSAPHPRGAKESACGCAGIFSAPVALSVYAQAFEEMDALDKFEDFASLNGCRFYGLPPNPEKILLKKEEWTVPETYDFGEAVVVPLHAGKTLKWKTLNV
ncbi:hypothetical protein BSKO_12104 [Bryopsis sp. KO-2023]|nr:hypothetical protein BSKO_12104 [Bryopsis sp. KO-2023]